MAINSTLQAVITAKLRAPDGNNTPLPGPIQYAQGADGVVYGFQLRKHNSTGKYIVAVASSSATCVVGVGSGSSSTSAAIASYPYEKLGVFFNRHPCNPRPSFRLV